jgi:hypothetical protein
VRALILLELRTPSTKLQPCREQPQLYRPPCHRSSPRGPDLRSPKPNSHSPAHDGQLDTDNARLAANVASPSNSVRPNTLHNIIRRRVGTPHQDAIHCQTAAFLPESFTALSSDRTRFQGLSAPDSRFSNLVGRTLRIGAHSAYRTGLRTGEAIVSMGSVEFCGGFESDAIRRGPPIPRI